MFTSNNSSNTIPFMIRPNIKEDLVDLPGYTSDQLDIENKLFIARAHLEAKGIKQPKSLLVKKRKRRKNNKT